MSVMSSAVSVREATEADLPAILRVYAQPELDHGRVLDLDQARGQWRRIHEHPDYKVYVAELDRVVVKVLVGYPEALVEQGILDRYVQGFEADRTETYGVRPVTNAPGLERLRKRVDAVRVESRITSYITGIVRATRDAASLTLGASPRAGVSLLKAARSAALLEQRDYVIPDDVKSLAPAVLRHRITLAPELELEGVTADQALKAILEKVEVPTA
jgi:MoxR-like ATPase